MVLRQKRSYYSDIEEAPLRITKAVEYAIRCVLYLATVGKHKLVTRKQIGASMDIPDQFLRKIAQQLAKAEIIDIVQGPRGGYRLLMEPEELTLLDVVEAMIGKICLNECVVDPDFCFRSPTCSVHGVWQKATEQLRQTLKESTFSKLIEQGSCVLEQGHMALGGA